MPGRLVAGCQVRVKEGLKIITNTPPIKDNQRAVMEFHLINHPVDCPICDQSGECKLQDYYVQYDAKGSRLQTTKVGKPKRKDLGPQQVPQTDRGPHARRDRRAGAGVP
jgi:NADH-quinone oxidoreductase subunit G